MSDMLSNPIDLHTYLTDAKFKQRVLQSKAWQNYLALPPIPDFDEDAARAEIEQRNGIRSASHLPLLDVKKEIARLREAYESDSFSNRFDILSMACIEEIYGPLTPKGFNSHSGMIAFVASKKNLIYDLLTKNRH
jgi:hypothetical protein